MTQETLAQVVERLAQEIADEMYGDPFGKGAARCALEQAIRAALAEPTTEMVRAAYRADGLRASFNAMAAERLKELG